MKLKLGKMSTKEIAKWLGVSYDTFRKNKKKFLSKLDLYAIYEPVYGGAIIKEIFIEEYDKNLDKEIDVQFLKEVTTAKDNLSTMSGMARKFCRNDVKKINNTRNQLTKTRNKLFGTGEKGNYGITGCREYVWAVKLSDYNVYRLLTDKELEVFNALIEKVYGVDNIEKIKANAILDQMYRESEDMTKEEYFELKESKGFNFFEQVIQSFKALTGLQLVHANKYELSLGFELTTSEREYRTYLLHKLED